MVGPLKLRESGNSIPNGCYEVPAENVRIAFQVVIPFFRDNEHVLDNEGKRTGAGPAHGLRTAGEPGRVVGSLFESRSWKRLATRFSVLFSVFSDARHQVLEVGPAAR